MYPGEQIDSNQAILLYTAASPVPAIYLERLQVDLLCRSSNIRPLIVLIEGILPVDIHLKEFIILLAPLILISTVCQ